LNNDEFTFSIDNIESLTSVNGVICEFELKNYKYFNAFSASELDGKQIDFKYEFKKSKLHRFEKDYN